MLRDEDEDVRGAAAEAFSWVATIDDLLDIERMLADDNPVVAQAAAKAFGRLASREDLERVLEESGTLFYGAIVMLDRAAYLPNCLRALFEDEDWIVRSED